MATFFGEVQFRSSRAYDEDEDESLIKRFDIDVSLNIENVKSSSLIVSYGVLANEFLDGCTQVKGLKPIGSLQLNKSDSFQTEPIDTGDFHERVLKPCLLYQTPDGTLLCQISSDVSPDITPKLANLLVSLVGSSDSVMILSSHHSSKLNSTDEFDPNSKCQTFSICTENFPSKRKSFPPLPQPSVLDSLPAAIMTECLMQDLPCVVYASFVETTSAGNVDLIVEDFNLAISRSPFVLEYSSKSFKRASEDADRYL